MFSCAKLRRLFYTAKQFALFYDDFVVSVLSALRDLRCPEHGDVAADGFGGAVVEDGLKRGEELLVSCFEEGDLDDVLSFCVHFLR